MTQATLWVTTRDGQREVGRLVLSAQTIIPTTKIAVNLFRTEREKLVARQELDWLKSLPARYDAPKV